MLKINYKVYSYLIFLFLIIQVIPLLFRDKLRIFIFFDYSVIITIILLYSIFTKKSTNSFVTLYSIALVIFSYLMFLFGYSGSISGFILSAIVPVFLVNNLNSIDLLTNYLYQPFKYASVFLIVFGTIMYYDILDLLSDKVLMGYIFGISSINYVSLLFYGYSSILLLLFFLYKKRNIKIKFVDYLIVYLVVLSSIFYSFIYDTRSTFISSCLLLIFLNIKYKKILFSLLLLSLFVFFDKILFFLIELMGTNDINALVVQDIRINSINNLISKSIEFDYDFTNNMSFSSLFNVLFSLFPLSFFLGFILIRDFFYILSIKDYETKFFFILIFSNAIFVSLYQMDFFSTFVLFFIGSTSSLFINKKKFNIVK